MCNSKSNQTRITCADMLKNPQCVFTNMTTSAVSENGEALMRHTPYATHTSPWYLGLDLAHCDIPHDRTEYCVFSLTTDDIAEPHLVISSPIESETVFPISITASGGFITMIFAIGDAIRDVKRRTALSPNPYADSEIYPLRCMNRTLFNGRYLHLALYPFGNKTDACANLRPIAFFDSLEAASAYDPCEHPFPYTSDIDALYEPFYEPATDALVESYKAQMEQRIHEITTTESVLTPDQIDGTCYYISSIHGNDDNDGLSPETAWKSITKLLVVGDEVGISTPLATYPAITHIPKRGDGVFLERGSVFNAELCTMHAGDYTMWLVDGVSYGAYGEGEKPVLTCCVDYNGSKNWVKTEYENVWMLDQKLTPPSISKSLGYHDIANIVVKAKDGKTGYGIKVLANTPEDSFNGKATVYMGKVTNGFEIFESGGVNLTCPGDLKNNLEYLHDWKGERVYLYCDKGNPAEAYESVILTRQGICAYGGSDCVVDNLAFKYVGTFGISTVNIKNLTIQNCTFEWTGGAIQFGTTIFGGGVQNWCNCDGFYIRNCYSNQSLDASFSTQGNGDGAKNVIMHDVVIEDCVAINTNSSVEIWNWASEHRLIANVSIKNNIFGYAGYHFGNRKAHPVKDACILQLGNNEGQILENVVFEKNRILYASSCCFWARPLLCRGDVNGTLIRDNTYILSNRKMYMLTSPDMRSDLFDPHRACVPFSKEAVRDLLALGIDCGSKYYYIDGYAFEGEDSGVYIAPYMMEDKKKRYIPSTLGTKQSEK